MSIFNFCDTVYGPCLSAATSQRIQRIQNFCLRFIYGIRRHQSVRHKFQDSKWLTMKQRRILHRGTLYHKIIISNSPTYLYRKITFRDDVHNLNLRYKGLLTPPYHKTALFERSFTFSIYKLYNPLPPQLKSCTSFSFAKQFKKHLVQS